MKPDETVGYILKTVDYGDHGKILYAYTSSGIISAIARGVKKMHSPLRHLVQAGMLVTMHLSKSKFPTLKEASMVKYHQAIRNDIIKTTVASTVRELIYYNVNEHDDHPKLFNFVLKFLDVLDTTEAPLELLMVFEMKFLYFLGYGISFNRCSRCEVSEKLSLDLYTGMMFCEQHADENTSLIKHETYQPLQYYLHVDVLKFQPLKLNKTTQTILSNIIDSLYETHLSTKTKAKQLLKSID